jgi:flagellar protein FlbD
MIQLTRLRHGDPFFLNPDLIERVDTHVDTVVRLTNGSEYLVNETGEEIVRRTAEFRARVIALAGLLQSANYRVDPVDEGPVTADTAPPGELTNPQGSAPTVEHAEEGAAGITPAELDEVVR